IAENANRKNLKTKNYKLAIKNAKEANAIAQKTGAWEQIMSANKVLSETHENMSNQTQALNYYKIYHEAKDSLFNLEKNRQIEELEIQYQTERKEKQIQLLEKNRELQEDKLKQSRNIQYISITATSVIMVLLFIIFYRYRHQKKLAAVLSEKNDVISKQREKYQKLNATKNRILSVISHELRSPLSLIINFSDLVQEGNLEKDRMIEYNRYTYQNAYSLLHLLENLLEWTKNQQNEIYIQHRKQLLYPVIINNLEILNNLAKNKNIKIKTAIKNEETQAFFDYDMISTAMRNLISNAIKFTPEGGKIEISVEERENEVKIEVKDTGVGISNTDKQKILDEFNHYTNTGTQQEKGTGIGLVITKEFIEKNNGNLYIESKPNEGSKFWFTLPKETNI
ncbi:MAG: sensor histidine kinase, partial [Bacteroidales bacterium]